jgi:hypothetical protein
LEWLSVGSISMWLSHLAGSVFLSIGVSRWQSGTCGFHQWRSSAAASFKGGIPPPPLTIGAVHKNQAASEAMMLNELVKGQKA